MVIDVIVIVMYIYILMSIILSSICILMAITVLSFGYIPMFIL